MLAALNPATWPLIGAGARASMPLWRLLGRGRFNPFRPGGQPTYRGKPFPEGATTAAPIRPSLRTPGGTTYNPDTGRYGTAYAGTTRGAPYVNRPLMDPKLYNTGRAGALNPQAHRWRFGGAVLGAAAGLPLIMGGDEEIPMGMPLPSQAGGAGPGSFLPSALERSESARQRWMKNLQTATTYGGILGAIDPDKKESFNKDISEAMKQMSAYTQDVELSKITDVALKAGQTPRERYMAMIREGATPEEAALVSGHQVELMKAEQTSMGAKAQVWDQIMQTLMAGDTQTAALMLVQAWGTNQLGGAPMSENLQVRMEAATALLTGIASGETSPTAPGAGSGITDISLA
jgi:hypothetical protein